MIKVWRTGACTSALLLSSVGLTGGMAGPSTLRDGSFRLIYQVQPRSQHLLQASDGLYGVIGSDEYVRTTQMVVPVSVTVTYVHQTNACDERQCDMLGHQSFVLNKSGSTPGWRVESNRIILKLDDAQGRLRREAKKRYGSRYYLTSYLVTLKFSNGKSYRTVLIGLT
ncbi:hypothetical protein [Deinococcus radiodurans]|jgi:hypothetical protein|uniref:Uncharacterized protein n=1 Tax=Deinococcus radiodurans (strain ATCC 13939 / DSM 20539 / JCM 16871 / CCUG 27074 / LMG 4051 / NBRC 15346 / NCIMB 9279 / VKM B-1422 / R1) TaxID=243230 RepID=Q9RZH1_DEIRA|nr:hypothetical protein [Deinococcus radiodurans]AAF12693.1 hypothetical protein DR_C0014 [Deinococcus radiodurans R1 = ATCC 13939 = DSM 20539]ANC73345.1 hypothetical protein A2G07_15970 [Deinococcus radiodurans R1 = ATCC 13939 = DSM 20539]QEM73366.1 hypothetical protein DXG80_16395 [Deinococcus radiodurans]QIP30743.1 hypothetical protein HAV23_15970 [Deinococcus radiodurans]QIP33648.1 hypothetical protein HAV35_16025 [Deinococcus radiodurans]